MPWRGQAGPLLLDIITDIQNKLAGIGSGGAGPEILVENFKRKSGEQDDTGRLQRAIDSAPEGAEILFDPKVKYYWTSVKSKKALTININGAAAELNPYAIQTPAIWFQGDIGESQPLTADVADGGRTITVTDPSKFAKGDYIVIADKFVTAPWSTGGSSYTGRSEINMVASISGNVLTLVRQVEWPYAMSVEATVSKVANFINQPRIINSGNLVEKDPGAESKNQPALSGKGHLFQFEYCILPEVKGINIDGWQMHIVNMYRCIFGLVKKIQAKKPYRPAAGGHGYGTRFDSCMGGVMEYSYIDGARHLVDWSRCYDGLSQYNVAINPSGVSYYTHGLGSKRIKSLEDAVSGSTTTDEGWCMGDPEFSRDYDFTVENPSFRGVGPGIAMKTGSKGMKVLNPNIHSRADFAIAVTRGADGFTMIGGEVDNFNTTGTGKYGLLVQALTGTGTQIEHPKNITVKGTKFIGNSIVRVEAEGSIVIEDIESDVTIVTNAGNGAAIRVCEAVAPVDLIIKGNKLKGAFDRGIFGSIAPTGQYIVEDNNIKGYRTGGVQLRAAGNLRLMDNKVVPTGSVEPYQFSGTLGTELTNGAIVRNNEPNKSSQAGTFTATGNGTIASFDIPHTLLAKPRKLNAVSGNAATGAVGIKSVVPYADKLTVALNSAPAADTALIIYWNAEI